MRKTSYLVAFVLILVGCALWMIIGASSQLRSYFRLSAEVPGELVELEVEEVKKDRYRLQAHYTYTFRETPYVSKNFIGKSYPNPYAAHQVKKNFEELSIPVWLNPNKPTETTLEHHFPTKVVFSSILLILIVLYFLGLGRYVQSKN